MTTTSDFMMIFRFTPNFHYKPTTEEQARMKEHWGRFIGNIALKEKLVSTHQLGFEANRITPDLEVTEGISVLDNQTMGGNLIVRAKSLTEATELAKDCPILTMGGTVEVRSIIPMNN
ncbi:MAG: YciI family protein [Bacteroidota bacterium]